MASDPRRPILPQARPAPADATRVETGFRTGNMRDHLRGYVNKFGNTLDIEELQQINALLDRTQGMAEAVETGQAPMGEFPLLEAFGIGDQLRNDVPRPPEAGGGLPAIGKLLNVSPAGAPQPGLSNAESVADGRTFPLQEAAIGGAIGGGQTYPAGIVDRIEGGYGVVETDQGFRDVPLDQLPEGTREGAVLQPMMRRHQESKPYGKMMKRTTKATPIGGDREARIRELFARLRAQRGI